MTSKGNNGSAKKTLEDHVQTILLSLITAATIGAFTFLWSMNRTMGIYGEQLFQRKQDIDDIKKTIGDLHLDVNSLRLEIHDTNQKK